MNWIAYHVVQQEIAEKAVAKERSRQARRVLALQRQGVREHASRPGLARGTRVLSREEAVAAIAKKSRRGAMRLLSGYLQRIPEKRGR